jgi:hypoxanthine-guanine phosphoribosyltransferase
LLLNKKGDPEYANSKGEDALTIATIHGSLPAVAELFRQLEYNMSVSLLATTLIRNFSVSASAAANA